MSSPVIIRPKAGADIRKIYAELDQIHPTIARNFEQRLRELLDRIEFMPGAYGVIWRDVRAAKVKRFRYVVYYVEFSDRVEVIAVIHGSRDASAWKSRN